MRHASMLWGNVKRELGKFLTKVFVGGSLTGTGTEADPIELKGDLKNPGASKYYGTDEHEVLTYHDFPEIGGDYKWNLKGKGVLPEISNIQVIQDGDSGNYNDLPDAFFYISAFNKHGETIPQPVQSFRFYFEENSEAIITWDEINGADGYYIYGEIMEEDDLLVASERFEVLNNEFDLMNPDYPIARGINLTEKLQKNTAVSDAVISFEIKDDDTVKVEAENAIVVVTESEDKKEKNLLIKVEKPDISDLDDAKRWWNLGTGEGLENVPGIKFTQEKRNDDFVIWKNHLFISAYNSNGETLPLPLVDDFKMYLQQNHGIINWSKLPNADGYYLYLGVGGGVINGDAVNLSWYKYDIDDNNITEIDLQDLDDFSYVKVYEIPTENTTGFSEFRIEHDDLLEIEGDGIGVELTADGRRKKLKLSADNEGGGGSFDITDGTETVSIDPDDQVTLVGDGVEIEVSEDEQDNTKKEIKFSLDNICDIIANCDIIKDLQEKIIELEQDVRGESFITEWHLPAGNFTLPLQAGASYDMKVDWDDNGAKSEVKTFDDVNKTYYYSEPGIRRIRITGKCSSWYINNDASIKDLIHKVIQWGEVDFNVLNFDGCSNLTIPNTPITGVANLLNFKRSFRNCVKINFIPLNFFDFAVNVAEDAFYETFRGCSGLTGAIPATLFATNTLVSTNGFYSTFYGCYGLTGSIPAT